MFFPLQFSTLNTSHHAPFGYVSIPPTPCCCPMLFFAKKKTITVQFCIQREPNSLCSWTTVALYCADSGEDPHTERSRWLHDPSHTVPALTITSCAVHPFTETYTLTQLLLLTVEQQLFPHPVPQTHITVHNTCYSKTHKQRFTSLK